MKCKIFLLNVDAVFRQEEHKTAPHLWWMFFRQGDLGWETPLEAFAFLSSVIKARGPMFGPDRLPVTEKGIILESRSAFGNGVALMPISWDDLKSVSFFQIKF